MFLTVILIVLSWVCPSEEWDGKVLLQLFMWGKSRNLSLDSLPRVFILCISIVVSIYFRKLISVIHIPLPHKGIYMLIALLMYLVLNSFKLVDSQISIGQTLVDGFLTENSSCLLAIYLPLCILKISYNIDTHLFVRALPQILLLATIGLIVFGIMIGAALPLLKIGDGSETSRGFGYLYGCSMTSIDNLEIADSLREFESVRYVLITLEGECLLGIGISHMLLAICLGVLNGYVNMWYHAILISVRMIGGGAIVGSIIGKCIAYVMEIMFNEFNSIFIAMVVAVCSSYFICEFVLYFSGPIATLMVCYFICSERGRLTSDTNVKVRLALDITYGCVEQFLYLYFTLEASYIAYQNINQNKIFHYVVIYISSLLCRMMSLIILLPILYRIGYGIDFRSILAIFWLAKKGVIQLALFSNLLAVRQIKTNAETIISYNWVYVLLSIIINGSTSKIFLRTFGLTVITQTRKSNMTSCIRFIEAKKMRYISMMRMNRILSDVNWNIVKHFTVLEHPYKLNTSEEDSENFLLGNRKSYCGDCNKEIAVEPTKKEIHQMQNEAKIRVLKAQKVSFVKQHERGLLTPEGLKPLLLQIELAMDTEKLMLNLKDLLSNFGGHSWYVRIKEFLVSVDIGDVQYKKPRKRSRKICYMIAMNKLYDVFIYFLIILNAVVYIHYINRESDIVGLCFKIMAFFIFVLEMWLKIMAFSHIYIRDGVRLYFQSHWRKIEFLFLICETIEILVQSYLILISYHSDAFSMGTMISFSAARILRLLKFIVIMYELRDKFIMLCQKKIDTETACAFEIAQALLLSFEEVLHMLPQIIENKNIAEYIEKLMVANKTIVSKELELAQKRAPWVSVTVKSKQVMRATLNSVKDTVQTLKGSGMIDDFEYGQLNQGFQTCFKSILKLKTVPGKSPETTFFELPWLDSSDDISIFLHINSIMMSWETDEVICFEDFDFNGIYVILEGFARITYHSNRFIAAGILPITDYITSNNFLENTEEYLIPGNSFGELSAMTGRPSDCNIVCETPIKAYLIPSNILYDAIKIFDETQIGLYNTIWKYISIHMAANLLWETPIYKKHTKEELYYLLMKSFVPNLTSHTVFVSSERVEDIVLIEGSVEDMNTNNVYIAPTFLPRSAQKIFLSRYNLPDPKLFIVPTKEIYQTAIMSYRDDQVAEDAVKFTARQKKRIKKAGAATRAFAMSVEERKSGRLRSILKNKSSS